MPLLRKKFDTFFIAENDGTFPDQLVLCCKLKELEVEHYVEIGKGMPHIWPLLPVMDESRKSLNRIIEILNK
jgi:acetyl esterase/lipase